MNPQSVYEKLVKLGHDWADKERAANLLESSLKSYKAKLAIEFKDNGCGVAEADLKAEASQDYADAKSAFINARAESMKAKVNYFAAQEYFKMYTELEKSERFSAKYQT